MIDIDTITPESHTIDDLALDSLDFLDIVFAIDKEFGIKLEKWTQEVNDGKASTRRLLRHQEPVRQDRRAGRRKDRLKSGERSKAPA